MSSLRAVGIPRLLFRVTCKKSRPQSPYYIQILNTNADVIRDIPLVISAYLIWKFYKKTKIYNLSDIPLMDALRQADLEEEARYHD